MEFERIDIDSKLGREALKHLKGKRKVNELYLNAVVSKCQRSLAKFDIVEAMEDDMHGKMMKKIEDEFGLITGFFIFLSRSQKESDDEILLTLKAEIYATDNE